MRRVKEVSGSGARPRGFRHTLRQGSRGQLRGTSLVEAIVAAVVFLIVFAATMELLPRLTLRADDALLVAEAEYRVERASERYGSGWWPAGTYTERYDWGCVTIRIEPYRSFTDIRTMTVEARIDGSRKRIVLKQIAECRE